MNAKDAIKNVVEFCHMVTTMYVQDLEPEDLFVRSVPNTNHIAWQLGHLIASDHQMLSELGYTAPDLPENFAAAHTTETAGSDEPASFHTKDEYLALEDQMKAAALAAIDATLDADLDKPAPESMRGYAPTVAAVLTMVGTHWLLHAGQFVPIRRKIGKPPLI